MSGEALATIFAALIAAGLPLIIRHYSRAARSDSIAFGSRITIRAFDGKCATVRHDRRIAAQNKNRRGDQQTFTLVSPDKPLAKRRHGPLRYGSSVAFRFDDDDTFIGADADHGGELWCWVGWVKAWEIFIVDRPPGVSRWRSSTLRSGGLVALRASNTKLVRYDAEGSAELAAQVKTIREWEVFAIVAAEVSSN